jgi:hypothetical protein
MSGQFGAQGVTLFNERFLNREFITAYINEYVGFQLPFLGSMPRVETNSQTISATKETYGILENPELRTMRPMVMGTEFKDIEISRLEQISASIKGRGFRIKIGNEARIYQEGIDDLARAYQFIGMLAIKDINDEMCTALQKGVRQSKSGEKFYDWVHSSGHKRWTEEGCATYIKDISRLRRTLQYLEKPYMLDSVYVGMDEFDTFGEYLAELNISQDSKRVMFWAEMNQAVPTITLGAMGITVNRVRSGIASGTILGLDSQNPPCTMYYTNNPLFPQAVDNFPSPVKPLGLHVLTQDKRNDGFYEIKVWFENAFMARAPDAGIVGTGI